MLGSLHKGIRQAGLWLVVMAFTLRAIVPQGFMVGAVEGQRIAITLCSPSGSSVFLDLRTGAIEVDDKPGIPDPQSNDGHGACPFATTSSLVVPTQIAAVLAPNQWVVAAPVGPRADQIFAESTGPPQPARAPPFSA